MKLGWLSHCIMAVTFTGLGLMSLISPTNLTPLVELTMTTPVAIMEIRGVYGGLFLGIGVLFLLFARHGAWLRPLLIGDRRLFRSLAEN